MRDVRSADCRAGYLAMVSLCAAVSVVSFTASGNEPVQAMGAKSAVVVLTVQDDGRDITMPVSGSLTVRLDTMPGTGYGWQVAQNGSPQLHAEGPARFEPRSKLEAGGAEEEVFQFRARAAGATELEFHYRRPWEKTDASTKTFKVRIKVE